LFTIMVYSMRKMIRKWLGIKDFPLFEVRSEIHEILYSQPYFEDIVGRLERRRKTKEVEDLHNTIQQAIDFQVSGEKFIDDIVERIRKKQL
jgi:hypothetical protein